MPCFGGVGSRTTTGCLQLSMHMSVHMSIHMSIRMSIHMSKYTCRYAPLYTCRYTRLYTCLCTGLHPCAIPRYCPGLPKWAGAGLLPAWNQKCPLMCAFGTKRRVLVHKKFPNRARFGLLPHLKHGMHLEGALTHLDYKRS